MDRRAKGQEILDDVFGGRMTASGPAFVDMIEISTDYLFGEIWSRPGLALRDRSLVTVSVLCATGKEPQLRGHLKGALNVGHTPDALKEVMIHVAHYAGWPAGMNGLQVLQDVVTELGLEFSGPYDGVDDTAPSG